METLETIMKRYSLHSLIYKEIIKNINQSDIHNWIDVYD